LRKKATFFLFAGRLGAGGWALSRVQLPALERHHKLHRYSRATQREWRKSHRDGLKQSWRDDWRRSVSRFSTEIRGAENASFEPQFLKY
jgi:hypothetical protein